MRSIYFVTVIFAIGGCASVPRMPSEGMVETAIAQTLSAQPNSTDTPMPIATNTPSPTLTPTKVPLSELDLEPFLIQPGDLPAGLSGGQSSNSPPEMFDELPEAVYEIDQRFERNGDIQGGVTVFLYEGEDDLQLAYNLLLEGFGDSTESISDVGEKAEYTNIYMEMLGMKMDASEVAFARCNALVHIRMSDVEQRQIISYAQGLDRRLANIVCESPLNIPEPVITQIPTPTLSIEEHRQNVLNEIIKYLENKDNIFEVESVSAVRFNAPGILEIEVKTIYSAQKNQPDISYRIISNLSPVFIDSIKKERLFWLGGGDDFVIHITTYSSDGHYRYQSDTNYETMEKIKNKQISYEEWIAASNAGFR